jgi:hypothetical protein
MKRRGLRLRDAALALLFCLAGGAAFADDVADCNQQKDLDLRIRGCGALLKSPQLPVGDKAVVLQLRGNAYRVKRDYSSALADYVEAMTFADDDTVRRSVEGGIMMTLTQGPPELRTSPNGKKAIDLLERNFQKSKAPRPAPKQ